VRLNYFVNVRLELLQLDFKLLLQTLLSLALAEADLAEIERISNWFSAPAELSLRRLEETHCYRGGNGNRSGFVSSEMPFKKSRG